MVLRFVVLCLVLVYPVLYAEDDFEDLSAIDNPWEGNTKLACTVISKATQGVATANSFIQAKQKSQAAQEEYRQLMGKMLYEAQNETGVAVDEIDTQTLATVMAEFESEEEGSGETWSAFDYTRTALSVAAIADPTGVIGVGAAYTYPKCGTKEAKNSSGGFCWKDSNVRDAGTWVGDLGRVADCPRGYTNNGLTCGRGADSYRWPSRVADCPRGYTNNGLTCGRGADSYSQPSRVADCPKGYDNTGLTCHRWWPPHTIGGTSSMSCKKGEWFQAGRCYKNCRPGYTNMGESCFRGVSTLGLNSMRCNSDEWFQAGRCYKNCKPGYTNMGESCYKPPSTLGIKSMRCKSGEFKQGPRCFSNDICGAGKELDGLLCYNKCGAAQKGIGPVCWSSCSGKLNVACAAGCASSSAECALATTDMVASPFEMVASIASLGGYSSAKASRKAATLASRQAAKQVVKKGTKTALQKGARSIAAGLNDTMIETAKQAKSNGAEAAAKFLRKNMIDGAEAAARRTEAVVANLKNKYSTVKSTVKRKVFNPIKAKAARLDKAARAKSPNFDRFRKTQKQITEGLSNAHWQVKQNRKLGYAKMAKGCGQIGLEIWDVATE